MSGNAGFSPLVIEERGDVWLLVLPLRYVDEKLEIVVPAGFETDLASIPRPLWSFLPAWGRWSRAAVLHDWLYFGDRSRGRRFADDLFYQALVRSGVNRLKSGLFWVSVRLAGWVWWL